VRKYAMGSLLPLSSSSSGRTFPFNPILRERRIENTAAASVEDTMAPSNSPSFRDIFRKYEEKIPTTAAVINTPMVDNDIPLFSTGFTLSHFVSSPPEKSINVSATTPRNSAIFGSLKYIPPRPSDPATIPTIRNSINAGIPNRKEVLLEMMLTNRRSDPKSRMLCEESSMVRLVVKLKKVKIKKRKRRFQSVDRSP
jgi:hypothetical protein